VPNTETTLTVPAQSSPSDPYTVNTTNQEVSTLAIAGIINTGTLSGRTEYADCEYVFAGALRTLDYPLHPGVAFSARGKKLQWCGINPMGGLKWFDVPTVKEEDL